MKKLLAVLLAALLLAAPAFAQTASLAGEWTMTKTVASGVVMSPEAYGLSMTIVLNPDGTAFARQTINGAPMEENGTWTQAGNTVTITSQLTGEVSTFTLQSDGTLLAPASIERPDIWYCMIDISHDDGYTWEAVRIPMPLEPDADPRTTLIQPTLWEAPAGCVHALMRTNRGCAYRSDSTDGGRSWCTAYPTEIPNNGSGLDLTQLRDGTLALVSNPVARHRYPLTLGFSDNGGQSFRRVLTLEDDVGEFSYPAVIADGNTLYITYTYDRRGIAFFEVTLAGDEPAGARPGSTPAGA